MITSADTTGNEVNNPIDLAAQDEELGSSSTERLPEFVSETAAPKKTQELRTLS